MLSQLIKNANNKFKQGHHPLTIVPIIVAVLSTVKNVVADNSYDSDNSLQIATRIIEVLELYYSVFVYFLTFWLRGQQLARFLRNLVVGLPLLHKLIPTWLCHGAGLIIFEVTSLLKRKLKP